QRFLADGAPFAARRRPLARRAAVRLGLPDPRVAADARPPAGLPRLRREPDRLQPQGDVRRAGSVAAGMVRAAPGLSPTAPLPASRRQAATPPNPIHATRGHRP